jgi:hypothetical protein
MIKNSLPAALFVALTMAMSFAPPALAKKLDSRGVVGREVAAPPWSAACMSDQGPRQCDEPMWVYGSPAYVSRFRDAF